MGKLRADLLAAFAILVLAVPSARADVFQIVDGRVLGNTFFWNWTGTSPVPPAALAGVNVTQAELNFNVPMPDLVVRPGEVFSVSPPLTGEFTGFVNLAGLDGNIQGQGDLHFVQPSLLAPAFPGPADELGLITFRLPFSMAGTLNGAVVEFFNSGPEHTLGTFSDRVAGRGTAEIAFLAREATGDYQLAGWRYVFAPAAPIPEPSTLLLLGGGLAALVRLPRRRPRPQNA